MVLDSRSLDGPWWCVLVYWMGVCLLIYIYGLYRADNTCSLLFVVCCIDIDAFRRTYSVVRIQTYVFNNLLVIN